MAKHEEPHKDITIALTRGEVLHLHREIGDLPRPRVGPKLFELYRRLDVALSIDLSKQNGKRVRA